MRIALRIFSESRDEGKSEGPIFNITRMAEDDLIPSCDVQCRDYLNRLYDCEEEE
jgi:hypothetical protein